MMWLPTIGFGIYAIRPLVSIAVPIGILLLVGCAICWKSIVALAALLLSPVTVLFAFGISDWFSNRPRFYGMGLPGRDYFNLDSTTRCYRATGGCVVTGGEWLFELPHNAGLATMCAIFGPPSATYHGLYPRLEEARDLTTTASITAIQTFLEGAVVVEGASIELGKKVVEDILWDFDDDFAGIELDGVANEIKATVLQGQCLMVRVHATYPGSRFGDESDGIYLFDRRRMRPFARYILKGTSPRIPRLLTALD